MIADGKLDKYGKANEQTPEEWKGKHPDYTNDAYSVKHVADPGHDWDKKKKDKVKVEKDLVGKRSADKEENEGPPTKKRKLSDSKGSDDDDSEEEEKKEKEKKKKKKKKKDKKDKKEKKEKKDKKDKKSKKKKKKKSSGIEVD